MVLVFTLILCAAIVATCEWLDRPPRKCERCGSTDIETIRGYYNAWMYRCRNCMM